MGSTLRIGVDVGGTNTDAVVMQDRQVVAAVKRPTSTDVGSGIAAALRAVLKTAAVGAADIAAVMIGTTHFTNAFVEARGLDKVGVLRIAYPATTSIPPMYGWPAELARLVHGGSCIVPGGYEFNGREIAAFDERAVRDAARTMRERGLTSIAIASVFAPLNRSMEDRAAGIVREEIPGAVISVSADFGRLGLLERENAAIINASLSGLGKLVIASFERALRDLDIRSPLYISQNDGTLMSAAHAARFPVMTFASGPTNSMRGAALLAGITDALVVDIGGTTTDVGCLRGGFPRESALSVDIGGVRTNFRMPDVVSVGIGGGSRVSVGVGDRVSVGPTSVGLHLLSQALVFGGQTLTATDIAVAAGLADIGDRSRVAHLSADLVRRSLAAIKAGIESAIDRITLSADAVPAILVGGGNVLVAAGLDGVSPLAIPPHHAVANAVGAAIAQAGGEIDRCYSYDQVGRAAALETARALAIENARSNGAVPATIQVTDVEELPLAYLPGGTTRIRVRAVGEMAVTPTGGSETGR
jgi:N-methylhydantoinase A/oxoprolinase/acetone carboxylase beta subunit